MTAEPTRPPNALGADDLREARSLMARVAAGDPRAERALVDRILPRARRTTGALLRDAADADDACQLALLEVLAAAPSFQGRGSLERWVDRIVIRTALLHGRREARRRRGRDAHADVDQVDPLHVGPTREAAAFRHLADEEIRGYLDQLSEPRRTALVLRHVLGHSVAEIAELTGVSTNTVKDRLLTARQQFRKLVRRDALLGTGSRRLG